MKKFIKIFFRIITMPFVTIFILLAALRHCLYFMIDYMKFGGELIAYPENPILIKDVYEKLKEAQKTK